MTQSTKPTELPVDLQIADSVNNVPLARHLPDQKADELKKYWCSWPANALERLPWPYTLTVIVAALLALGEQLLENSLEIASTGRNYQVSPFRLAVFPLLVIYILGHFAVVKRVSIQALVDLRPAVLVEDDEYDQRVRRLISTNPWIELLLLLIAILVVVGLFIGLNADLLNSNSGIPSEWPTALFILTMYVFLGWLLLELVYNSVRQARALAALARCPLIINVFDPVHLLPFGRLGLVLSLPIVGIVLIPLILFGAPTMGGYLVIVISSISFLALFIPLWGVHVQINQAQDRTLNGIHHQLQGIHDRLIPEQPADSAEISAMNNRLSLLLQLKRAVMEAPSWPFKDSADVARAILAVTSPLIYFILNELIRTYLLPLLSGGGAP